MPTTPAVAAHHRSPNAEQAIADGRFSLQLHPRREDWAVVEDWMTDEGWDPGFSDAQAVTALDPRALVIGMFEDKPVSALSLLRVSDSYAFLGNYLVHRDYRGQGFGLATWQAVLPHADGRVVGLDAVPERVETYQRCGFTAVFTTISYRGMIPRPQSAMDPRVRPLESGDRAAVVALDAECWSFERPAFLTVWFAASGARSLVYTDGREVTGFGMIRPSRSGYRIGPLAARTPQAASALFDALTARHAGEQVRLNCPQPNAAGCELARDKGLFRASHTIRMYSHPVRPAALAHSYSTASLAWG